MWKATNEIRGLNEQLSASSIPGKCLLRQMCFGILDTDKVANDIEKDLRKLQQHLKVERLITVFRSKLLNTNDNQFEDAVYEVAIAAVGADFMDNGTLELEKPISGSNGNSDIAGQRSGHSWRIEVTVVHHHVPSFDASEEEGQATMRAMMERHDWKSIKHANPPSMKTMADVAKGNPDYNPNPQSTTIFQTLDRKRRQCEVDARNIIVLGLPLPLSDLPSEHALTGAAFVEVGSE